MRYRLADWFAVTALRGRRDMVTGANEDDFHLRGVDVARDIAHARWLDLREVREGEPCPMCSAPLAVEKTIEHVLDIMLVEQDGMVGAPREGSA